MCVGVLVIFWNRAVGFYNYNELSNLEPFDLETEVAQYEFQIIFYLLGYYQYQLDLVARIEPNLI